MRALVWFRSDLRVEDNRALYQACDRAGRGVMAVFLVASDQWREHDWGSNKVNFVLRHVASLSERLETLGVPLLVREAKRFDAAPKTLLALAREHECDELFCNIEYEVNERRRDEAVRDAFEEAGLKMHLVEDQTIVPPLEVRTQSDGFYKVYTPFRRTWEQMIASGYDWQPVGVPKRVGQVPAEPDRVPEQLSGFEPDEQVLSLWPVGEGNAKRRLTAFAKHRMEEYHEQRDLPAEAGTSELSPYLAAGVISPRLCLQAALDANDGRLRSGRKGITTWIGEIIWREFYRHILRCFPRVSMNRPFREETEDIPWSCDEDAFDRWRQGRTGVPIVDAGMRQLHQTGWMHNRVRMIVAMFLTKNLLIDWRWGERHFMQHLVDGDLANNNGGWQWSASTGTDAAPYFRIFNPVSQSEKHDPDGRYIRRFVPELVGVADKAIHDPARLPDSSRNQLDYPLPLVDLKKSRQHAIDTFKQVLSGSDPD